MPAALAALSLVLLGGMTAQAGELKAWRGGATPPLALGDTAGKTRDLAAYRGKVVLLNFWATWCEPCRDEMPSIQALRAKFAGRPFEVLAINMMESEEKIAAFQQSELIDLPVLMDRDGAVAKRWKVRMLPISFLIDREGAIRYQLVGEANWTAKEITSVVERLMVSAPAGARAAAAITER